MIYIHVLSDYLETFELVDLKSIFLIDLYYEVSVEVALCIRFK